MDHTSSTSLTIGERIFSGLILCGEICNTLALVMVCIVFSFLTFDLPNLLSGSDRSGN